MRISLCVFILACLWAATASAHPVKVDLTDPLPCHGSVCEPLIWRGHDHRDVVDGTSGEEHLYGYGGPDKLIGRGEADWLRGGPGRDRLIAGRSHDHMWGGPGKDVLDCGPSSHGLGDTATGGPGADVFVNCEIISDFNPDEGDQRSHIHHRSFDASGL